MASAAKHALLGVLATVLSLSQAASAGANTSLSPGDLMIWSPVKVAPRTYKTTVGFRLPMAWDVSAGVDLGLAGAINGTIPRDSRLATFWWMAVDHPGRFSNSPMREMALRVDTLNGAGSLCFGRTHSWIASEDLDMRSSRSLSLNYAGGQNEPTLITASQAVTVAVPWTGTSISASGNLKQVGNIFSSAVSFHQPITPHLNFSASFADPQKLTPSGNLRLDYRVRW
ncbi:hypothetical protein [Rhizobium sp. BR 314]|uniref:hypothetical protein n=1 Tax=Rhizobium sp. BR 314 TaxID=3040013 RepID=UPI0039BFD672